MPVRHARAAWDGQLQDGRGTMAFGSGAFEGPYSFASRFEEGEGTNPEELIGAAHAGCFSMALAGVLGRAGYDPEHIETVADVHLDKVEGGFAIRTVQLNTTVRVTDIDEDEFQQHAEAAKKNCPVSQALSGGPEIRLNAKLER